MPIKFRTLFALFIVLSLSACSTGWFGEEEEPRIEGERLSVLQLQDQSSAVQSDRPENPFVTSRPWLNQFWPQAGGYPNHAMQHLAFNENTPELIWKESIGKGSTTRSPLTSQPIVVDGYIYTMDSAATIRAFDIDNGDEIWTKKLEKDQDETAHGGLGFGSGYIFVASGSGKVYALGPKTGELFWEKDLGAPLRAAPSVLDQRVYLVSLDNQLTVLDSETGERLWDFQGQQESAVLLGTANPAVNSKVVIAAFSSGQIFALRVENGSIAWSDRLAGLQGRPGQSNINDIKALPVIDKGLAFATSSAGRMVAIDIRSGQRVWEKNIGSVETPWVAGNRLFMITTNNELVSLDRDTGNIDWIKALQQYKDEEDREGAITWTRPVFAQARLIIMNNDGRALELNPTNGAPLHEWKTGHDITLPTTIAMQTLFALSESGVLLAYR